MKVDMKHTLLALLLAATAVSAQSGRPLPPDIDSRSYSRLPLIPKDSLGAATDLALRDAAATMALDFKQRPQIRALLPGGSGT